MARLSSLIVVFVLVLWVFGLFQGTFGIFFVRDYEPPLDTLLATILWWLPFPLLSGGLWLATLRLGLENRRGP